MKRIFLYSLLVVFVILILEKVYMFYENSNRDYDYILEFENMSRFNKNNLNVVGNFYDYTYESYKTGQIYYKKNNRKMTLYEAFRNKEVSIDEILGEMTVSKSSKKAYWTLYLYNGKGDIGSTKFSILECNNTYIFSKNDISIPENLCVK